MTKNKGITMIALVISVIILIIITSIILVVSLNNISVIDKATEAKASEGWNSKRDEIASAIIDLEQQLKIVGKDMTQTDMRQLLSNYGTPYDENGVVAGVDTVQNGRVKLTDVWGGNFDE